MVLTRLTIQPAIDDYNTNKLRLGIGVDKKKKEISNRPDRHSMSGNVYLQDTFDTAAVDWLVGRGK